MIICRNVYSYARSLDWEVGGEQETGTERERVFKSNRKIEKRVKVKSVIEQPCRWKFSLYAMA